MLTITIPGREMYDEKTQEFFTTKSYTLQLEHSLVSLSKWESKWKEPFLTNKNKTMEQTLDYIRCMTITQNIDPVVYNGLSSENIRAINSYIDDPMTATTFGQNDTKKNNEVVTAELIYYWMIALNIPFECQRWHLNKLLTLIRVCNVKNTPPKKMSRKEINSRNAALNAARRNKLHTTG